MSRRNSSVFDSHAIASREVASPTVERVANCTRVWSHGVVGLGIVGMMTAGLLAGCESGGGKQGDAVGSQRATPDNLGKSGDALVTPINLSNLVAASELRERALSVVAQLARSQNASIRANAIEAAAVAPRRLSEVLRRGLSDPNPAVRSVAAAAAGRAKVEQVLPQLRPLANDTYEHVRLSASFALARMGEPVEITPLGRSLYESDSMRTRSHAAFLLGELGNPTAIGMLRGASNKSVRGATPEEIRLFQLQIAEAMVKLGEDGQSQVIRAALFPSRPEDLEATALASQIIGQIKDRGAIDRLVFLSEFKDPRTGEKYPAEIRLVIAQSLAGMGLKGGEFIADEYAKNVNPLWRGQAALVYGAFGTPQTMGRVSQMLDDPAEEVRIAAANAVLKATSKGGQSR